jgi:hypothetical protein
MYLVAGERFDPLSLHLAYIPGRGVGVNFVLQNIGVFGFKGEKPPGIRIIGFKTANVKGVPLSPPRIL